MTEGYDVRVARGAAGYIASWLEFQRGLLRIPGLQAAIRAGDELVASIALGHADEPRRIPLGEHHLFRIASHSKTFTATAVMQLLERGRIRLDDPIGRWVPELAASAVAAVTIRELLGHQGGIIRDGVDRDFWQLMRPFPGRQELIGLCLGHGKVFAPNLHFKYTNVGYSLLGLAIEAASGEPYHDYVRRHIVESLGLRNTGPEYEPERASEYAAGHTGLLDGAEPREAIGHVDTRGMAAATGFYSTAVDLARYGAAHFFGHEELITDASKRLMQREESRLVSHGTELGRYGLGMDLTRIGSREVVGHSGGYPGHVTRTYIDPRDRLVVSVLTNCIGGAAETLAIGVVKLLNLAAAEHSVPAAPDGVDPARFTGRFAGLTAAIDIALLGGRLVGIYGAAADPTASYDELKIIDENTCELIPADGFGSVGERVEFKRSAAGVVELVRFCGGSMWPVEVFKARRSAQIAGLRTGGG